MTNELSELQAVDFALGGFIAAAFTGLSQETGPKEWREFLGRTTAAQIYRHDAESPAAFVKALQGSGLAKAGKQNALPLPVVYYSRKPGMTNSNDRSKPLDHRYVVADSLKHVYRMKFLRLDLDYSLTFVAWDRPTLDKMCLAWYAYITGADRAMATYRIGSETMEIPVTIDDHCNLTFTDASEPSESGRLFAANTTYTVNTLVLFGAEIPDPPSTMRIEYQISVGGIPLLSE